MNNPIIANIIRKMEAMLRAAAFKSFCCLKAKAIVQNYCKDFQSWQFTIKKIISFCLVGYEFSSIYQTSG